MDRDFRASLGHLALLSKGPSGFLNKPLGLLFKRIFFKGLGGFLEDRFTKLSPNMNIQNVNVWKQYFQKRQCFWINNIHGPAPANGCKDAALSICYRGEIVSPEQYDCLLSPEIGQL